jgi:KamA family protein
VNKYVEKHAEINNILISGGDPLTLSNKELEKIITKLPRVNKIRLGTRALTYEPNRFDKQLINLLKTYNIDLQTHINLPDEFDEETVLKLRNNRIVMRNQAVLLKGINDDAKILTRLFKKLVRYGIIPYYIFQCRPTYKNDKFIVTLKRGIRLINETRKNLSGMEKTFKYVMSNKIGKIEIIGIYKNHIVLKYHQCKNINMINKIVLIPLDNQRTWWR